MTGKANPNFAREAAERVAWAYFVVGAIVRQNLALPQPTLRDRLLNSVSPLPSIAYARS